MCKSIVKACVRYNDRLYTGFDHGECFKKLNEDNTILVHSEIEQGFVDSDGNFVDRKQAMIIAKESGQLRYEPDKKTLISEDLHLDWLNKQAQRIAELEEQLKNCIRPKFKVGQTVYTFNKNTECVYELCIKIIRIEINEISKFNSLVYLAERLEDGNFFGYFEVELFATKEEAEQKLAEIKGEKND